MDRHIAPLAATLSFHSWEVLSKRAESNHWTCPALGGILTFFKREQRSFSQNLDMYSGSWTYCCQPRVWGGLAELVNCSSRLVHGDVNGICFRCRSPTLGLVCGFLTTEKEHEHHGCPVPAIKVIGHKVICYVTANMLTCLRYWQCRTGRDIRNFSSNPPLSQMKLTPE